MENDKIRTCKICDNKFTEWTRTDGCFNCEDGIEEITDDFADYSRFRTCLSCKGTGYANYAETELCSESCVEDYIEEQLQ